MSTESTGVRDRQLISEVSAGNIEAFGELYNLYCDRAYRVALAVCSDNGRAQDAVQEAFLSVWRSAGGYLPRRGTVAAWLLTIVRYRAIDLARRKDSQGHQMAGDAWLDACAAPDDVHNTVVKHEQARQLRSALSALPDAQQEVITLAFYGQLSHTEIATQLRLPSGTIKGRMRLGLEKLRANLDRAIA